MNKKRSLLSILIPILLSLLLLSGCSRQSKEDLANEEAYRQLGINEMSAGNYEEALSMFQKALDLSPARISDLELDICYYKAAAQYLCGDSEGAIDTYTSLISYNSKNADAYYLRGTVSLASSDTEAALTDFKSSLKYDKKNASRYNMIAERLISVGLTEDADTILTEATELKGSSLSDTRELGVSYLLLGEYDTAETYLSKAKEGGDTEAIYELARLYEAIGDTEQASAMYLAYAEASGDSTEVLNDLGQDKLAHGEYEKALSFFQTALQNESADNRQELLRGEIASLEYLSDFSGAREKMESYLAEYPDDESAQREYEFLKSR